MTKEINNREYRQEALRGLINELHRGVEAEQVKKRFAEVFGGVSAEEISEAEQALIDGGMPVEEVQRLCDVHAALFKGSIEDIHKGGGGPDVRPGHPAHTLRAENRAIEETAQKARERLHTFLDSPAPEKGALLREALTGMGQIDLHYLKKENLLFPYLEKYGVTAPPKVMWGVDDEVRCMVKKAIEAVGRENEPEALRRKVEEMLDKVSEMIFKEENIMLPMLLQFLSPDEWAGIAADERELGYCLITPPPEWGAGQTVLARLAGADRDSLHMPTGSLNLPELIAMLDVLPADITFVDKDDTVKYFSNGRERIFPRTKAIIGRKVANCHPPASVHIVEGIVADLKSGKKDHEDFWLHIGGKYIYIRYFAVRSESGAYLGTMEVTQDIGPIQAIAGEKRLVEE